MIDRLPADLISGLEQFPGIVLRELELPGEKLSDIASLGGGEFAVRMGDVEQNGSGGKAKRIVAVARLCFRGFPRQHVENACNAHGFSLYTATMRVDMNQLSNDAHVWIFGISPALDRERSAVLLRNVQEFLDGWDAHGVPIRAAADLHEGSFLVVAADEKREKSGCSIDRMFGTLRRMEEELGVKILDANRLFMRSEEGIRAVPRGDFKRAAGPDTIVFDTTAEHLGEVRSGAWEKRAAESWHGRLL